MTSRRRGRQHTAVKFLRWYAPVAIVLVTLNLRPGLLTLGPVLPVIAHALNLTPLALGALTALPVLALGISSAVAVPVGRVFGWAGGLVLAMILDAAGIWLRSSGGDLNLFTGAVLLGTGIGLANVYVPTLVKSRYAAHIGIAMGGYTMALTCGALLSADLTPVLYLHYDDWRPALTIWAIPALIAAVAALPLLIDNRRPHQHVAGLGLWSNPVAWAVTIYWVCNRGCSTRWRNGCRCCSPAAVKR
jgi:CP family cyanate transporter-like MFS transporter